MIEKVLIVEGKNDRKRVEKLLAEPVNIVVTHGTLGYDKLETMIYPIEDEDVYILTDADDPGNKLRKQLGHELPNAAHLYIPKEFREVETTPLDVLQKVLAEYFEVKELDTYDLINDEYRQS